MKMHGALPSGLDWAADDDMEIFVYGTNAMGHREWLVPCMASLSEEDADALAALGCELNWELDRLDVVVRKMERALSLYEHKGGRTQETVVITLEAAQMSRASTVKTILELWPENGELVGIEETWEIGPWGGTLLGGSGEGRPIEKKRLLSVLPKLERAIEDIELCDYYSPYMGHRRIEDA